MATKAELQEKALQLEVDIYAGEDDDAKELTVAELKDAIAAKEAELEESNAEADEEAEAARKSAREAADREAAKAKAVDDSYRADATVDPDPELLAKMGIKGPSKADRELAEKHGYPVVVPGGKAYRTKVGIVCAFTGDLRPMGGVIILRDDHAANKLPFITAI